MAEICEYPVILVHGMFGWGEGEGINRKIPYWGASSGDLVDFFRECGAKECYAASVSPISSAWDRACELYAQLTGTRVDYGKAHSQKYNHRRYGRTYEKPLFDSWSAEKKIHLIGHSFGGNTVRLLVHLLENGAKEEQEATPEDEISGLFTGGKKDWVCSVVTLCSLHNGTLAFDVCNRYHIMPVLEGTAYNYAGIVGRTRLNGKFVDFHMEEYGLSNTPGKKDALPLRSVKRQLKKTDDSIRYDMSYEGAGKLNERIEISDNVYYFSYAFNAVGKKPGSKKYKPLYISFPFLKATSTLLLYDDRRFNSQTEDRFERFANDGLVNIWSAKYPSDEPHKEYDPENIVPGIWNVMPVQQGDHGAAIGLMTDSEKTHKLYKEIYDLISFAESESR